MTSPVRIHADYKTSRDELRAAVSSAVENGRPPLGFILGLLCTLVIIGIGFYAWRQTSIVADALANLR